MLVSLESLKLFSWLDRFFFSLTIGLNAFSFGSSLTDSLGDADFLWDSGDDDAAFWLNCVNNWFLEEKNNSLKLKCVKKSIQIKKSTS